MSNKNKPSFFSRFFKAIFGFMERHTDLTVVNPTETINTNMPTNVFDTAIVNELGFDVESGGGDLATGINPNYATNQNRPDYLVTEKFIDGALVALNIAAANERTAIIYAADYIPGTNPVYTRYTGQNIYTCENANFGFLTHSFSYIIGGNNDYEISLGTEPGLPNEPKDGDLRYFRLIINDTPNDGDITVKLRHSAGPSTIAVQYPFFTAVNDFSGVNGDAIKSKGYADVNNPGYSVYDLTYVYKNNDFATAWNLVDNHKNFDHYAAGRGYSGIQDAYINLLANQVDDDNPNEHALVSEKAIVDFVNTTSSGIESNKVFVSQENGDDTTGERQKRGRPFKTCLAAQQAAQPGDTIQVEEGDYLEGSLGKSFVDWYLEKGVIIGYDESQGPAFPSTQYTMTVFGDVESGAFTQMRYSISGEGQIRINTFNNTHAFYGILLGHFGSRINIQCESINLSTGTSNWNAVPEVRGRGANIGILAGGRVIAEVQSTDSSDGSVIEMDGGRANIRIKQLERQNEAMPVMTLRDSTVATKLVLLVDEVVGGLDEPDEVPSGFATGFTVFGGNVLLYTEGDNEQEVNFTCSSNIHGTIITNNTNNDSRYTMFINGDLTNSAITNDTALSDSGNLNIQCNGDVYLATLIKNAGSLSITANQIMLSPDPSTTNDDQLPRITELREGGKINLVADNITNRSVNPITIFHGEFSMNTQQYTPLKNTNTEYFVFEEDPNSNTTNTFIRLSGNIVGEQPTSPDFVFRNIPFDTADNAIDLKRVFIHGDVYFSANTNAVAPGGTNPTANAIEFIHGNVNVF